MAGAIAGAREIAKAPTGNLHGDYYLSADNTQYYLGVRDLNKGDHLRVDLNGTMCPLAVSIVLESDSGEKQILTAWPAVNQTIYIAPKQMRVTGVRWEIAYAGSPGMEPAVMVVRG